MFANPEEFPILFFHDEVTGKHACNALVFIYSTYMLVVLINT